MSFSILVSLYNPKDCLPEFVIWIDGIRSKISLDDHVYLKRKSTGLL